MRGAVSLALRDVIGAVSLAGRDVIGAGHPGYAFLAGVFCFMVSL